MLTLLLAIPAAVVAEGTESCLISPNPPAFVTSSLDAGLDPLHRLPHAISAVPHTGNHGQVVYGTEKFYLAHLPVFMSLPEAHPHNFQVILEVDFTDMDARASYLADRNLNPGVIYTALPPPFDQTALVIEHPGRKPLSRIPGTRLFRGHFEQGGQEILDDVEVEIKRVVHFREFQVDGPKVEDQHYLLFGEGEDVYLSHLLTAPPDFDQMLVVGIEVEDIATETLRDRVEALLASELYVHLPDRENFSAKRLRAGDKLKCSLDTGTRALPISVSLRVKEEAYCEVGEFSRPVTDQFNRQQRCET